MQIPQRNTKFKLKYIFITNNNQHLCFSYLVKGLLQRSSLPVSKVKKKKMLKNKSKPQFYNSKNSVYSSARWWIKESCTLRDDFFEILLNSRSSRLKIRFNPGLTASCFQFVSGNISVIYLVKEICDTLSYMYMYL